MSTSSGQEEDTRGGFHINFMTVSAHEPQSSEELLETPKGQTQRRRSNSDTESVRSYRKRKRRQTKTMTSTPNLYEMCVNDGNNESESNQNLENHYKSVSCENELNITNSVSKPNKYFPRGTMAYESIRSRQDIAGSVAKSYDLEDNEDTFSYVSSYLQPSFPKKNLEYTLRNSTLCMSAESVSAIDNDKLYPFPGDIDQSNKSSHDLSASQLNINQSNFSSHDISASRETIDGSKRAKNKKNKSKKQFSNNCDIQTEIKNDESVILGEKPTINSCYV